MDTNHCPDIVRGRRRAATPALLAGALLLLALLAPACVSTQAAEKDYEDAIELVRKNQPNAAISKLEDARDHDPAYQPAVLLLAEIYTRQGKLDAAEAVIVAFAEEVEDSPLANYRLGVIHEARGNETQALENYSKTIRTVSDYPDVHRRMGALLLRRGQAEAAVRVLETATGLDPTDAEAWYLLARACDRARDRDASVVAGRRFLELAKGNVELTREIEAVRQFLRSTRPPLDSLERAYMGGLIRTLLTTRSPAIERQAMRNNLVERAPSSLAERDDRAVWVRLFLPGDAGQRPLLRGESAGPTVVAALARVCEDLRSAPAFDRVLERIDEAAVVVDVESTREEPVTVRGPVDAGEQPNTSPPLLPGQDGLIVSNGPRRGAVLPSEAIHEGVDGVRGLLDLAMRRSGLPAGSWTERRIQMLQLRTDSFLVPARRGPTATRTWGGPVAAGRNDPIRILYGQSEPPPVTDTVLRASVEHGGAWLAGAVTSDGKFRYQYDALTDQSTDEGYEILRHCGSTFALIEAARASGRPEVAQAARLAASWLAKQVITDDQGSYLAFDGAAKLGGQALALLVFAEIAALDAKKAPTAPPKDGEGEGEGERKGLTREEATRLRDSLATRVVAMQREDGSFESYFKYSPEAFYSERPSRFYPGEAIYALAVTHTRTGDPRWLAAASHGAEALYAQREKERRAGDPPLDAWLLKGIAEIYRAQPEKRLLQRAYVLADTILDFQHTRNSAIHPTHVGGYGVPGELPWGAGTAALNEGVVAAAEMALRADDRPRARRYLDAATASARFQLRHQYRPQDAYYLPSPTRAIGGFRFHLLSDEIRIDTVQHNISSLLGLAELMKRGTAIGDGR